MENIIRTSGKNTFELINHGQVILSIKEILTMGVDDLLADGCTVTGNGCAIRFHNGTVLEIVMEQHDSVLVLHHIWQYGQEGPYRMHINVTEPQQKVCKAFIPAVWYQDNLAGEGKFPSLKQSDRWSFLETRMSMPGAIGLYDGFWCVASSLDPAQDASSLASVSWEGKTIIYTIPGAEWPYSYQGKTSLLPADDRQTRFLPRKAHDSFSRSLYILTGKGNDILAFWEAYLRAMLPILPVAPAPSCGWQLYASTKLTHLLSLIRKSEDGMAYLSMGEGNGDEQNVYRFTAGSFLVKGVEAALTFAKTTDCQDPHVQEQLQRISRLFGMPQDGHLLPQIAHRLGLYYLRGEKNGVYQDCINLESGEIGGYLGVSEHPEFKAMVNSRCTGEAMDSYVRLYAALANDGITEPEFLDTPKRVARFFCDCQLSDGSFGRWWTKEGMPVDTKGTNGAYIATFLTTLLPVLSKGDMLRGDSTGALIRACSFYADLVDDGLFYGDTLDADSCDKEAGIALLSLFLGAYDLFKDQRYLTVAKKAASFILTWVWQQDSFLPGASPLSERGFHTQGMTSVSVAHHHLDFYGMDIAVDFFRLAKVTGDPFYTRQAALMRDACRQLIATEKDMLGRDASFYGWQPEQINHTQWDYFNRPEMMNGHFDIDIAWVNVLGYDSYLNLKEMGALQ